MVLYSDNHTASLACMDELQLQHLVEVWTDRYQALRLLEQVHYVFIFENKGEAIGVTLQHPHGQIYGYPFIPPRPARELAAARTYASTQEGNCLHCAVLRQERTDGRRIVAQGTHFTAFIPFFAHFPYEVHLYANRCITSLVALTVDEQRDLAHVLKRVLLGYHALWDRSMPYIMAVHQAPTDGADYSRLAHLHFEFYPPNRTREKLKYLAGSESGAGAFIMDALPEVTAARLRDAIAGTSVREPVLRQWSENGESEQGTRASLE